jgi:hypothetical protein
MKFIPDPEGEYVCYDEELFDRKSLSWIKTGKRIRERLDNWEKDPEITMIELYENDLNPIRMTLDLELTKKHVRVRR